jgi:hypothetical protein
MKNNQIIALVVGISTLLIIGGVILASRAPKPADIIVSEESQVEIEETNYDWGEIQLQGGNVEKVFTIKNSGKADLKLANVSSSCMCTEAQIEIDDDISPLFGMHSNSSWVGSVRPDGQATLKVIFDPAYHGPSGTGQISRIVSVETNDQNNPELEFKLKAFVVN